MLVQDLAPQRGAMFVETSLFMRRTPAGCYVRRFVYGLKLHLYIAPRWGAGLLAAYIYKHPTPDGVVRQSNSELLNTPC